MCNFVWIGFIFELEQLCRCKVSFLDLNEEAEQDIKLEQYILYACLQSDGVTTTG